MLRSRWRWPPTILSVFQSLGSRRMTGKWRIVRMPDYPRDFPDMVEPTYILFDGNGGGEFAFGWSPARSTAPATQAISGSLGAAATKWTTRRATDGPTSSRMAPSKAKSASKMVMKPSSPPDRGRLPQQPAKATFDKDCSGRSAHPAAPVRVWLAQTRALRPSQGERRI
jgi:hypothetical protein